MIEQNSNTKKAAAKIFEPDIEYAKSQDLLREDKTQEAIDTLEKIVCRNPDYAHALNDLGVLYYRMGNKDKCIGYYEKAVSIDSDNANFRKNLADFYLVEEGRVEEALEIYLSVLKDNPEDIEVLMAAGHVCVAIGRNQSAKVFYERVLDIEPWNFDATEQMEKLS